jgi:hypothetical protein
MERCWWGSRIFVVGGEGTSCVFGQSQPYDVGQDSWEQFAAMATLRHGLGAAAIGNTVYIAVREPAMGGGFQSAGHEAFSV